MAKKKGQSLFDQFATTPGVAKKKLLKDQKKPGAKPTTPKTPKTPGVPGLGSGPSKTSVAPNLIGQYDPALDAQYRASQRGVDNLRQDTATSGGRRDEDVMGALGLAGQNRDRANQDFDSQLQGLFRQFGLQGQQQSQAANAAGVLHGGTQDAAAQVRGGNLAFARQPIDVGRGRTEEDYQRAVGDINRTAGREGEDAYTKLQRAIAEGSFYGADLSQEAIYQAGQNNPDLLAQLGGRGGTSNKTKKKNQQQQPPGQSNQPTKKKARKR